ncbi:MAG: glycoside hydrolase domain-containing protein [Pyrinomonadaceae bacterium]
MKKILFLAVLAFSIYGSANVFAQNGLDFTLAFGNTSRHLKFTYQEPQFLETHDSTIKDIVVFSDESGLVFTSDMLFRTDNGGQTWSTLPGPKSAGQRITSVLFDNEHEGIALITAVKTSSFEVARTSDGGATWTKDAAYLEGAAALELDIESALLTGSSNGLIELSVRIPTSSNFTGRAVYQSADGGRSWQFVSRSIELRREIEASAKVQKGSWVLETVGECSGFKTGCLQQTKLFISGKEALPPQLIDLVKREKEKAKKESAKTPMFAMPPGGSTRISLNRGFDKCTAAPASQMQLWWDNSYFQDANIYISGRNRGCTQAQLTAAWVNQVSAMGWGLIPTIVGYQSPCSVCTTCQKHSSDAATAETQGRGEADIAITDANNLGLTTGTVLYYDMERYDETVSTPGCRTSSTAFLKGWTERVKELGYISGVYGSPRNAIDDWQFMPPGSRMDAVWMARWDNVLSVWTYVSFATFPTNIWNNHQRIKQWQAPHNETWGGVTFNIDGNIADGPVAGVQIPKNKVADFDGDGKTDISVFRPSTGQWFISGTLGPTFSIYEFGVTTDILTPGDFDGDGKTDFAVFRPSDGTWYFRTKGGTFSARQFGVTGDIPAAADYNGDGKTDIAVFRPSTGLWYIAYSDSLNSFATVPFGENGDKPVVADYDGDGKADIAVWRPSNGTWYVQGSAGNYFTAIWGIATDLLAQADYDGDGKADFAVFRSGTWYLLRATNEISVQQFGVEGDVPATGDFDGDGRYDIAIFRPSNGTWHMSQSQNGYSVREFGVLNDKPITNAYLPQ